MKPWTFNCWTGNYLLKVSTTRRICRMAGGGLYRMEEWGDYSLAFPKYGPWRKTLTQAQKDRP